MRWQMALNKYLILNIVEENTADFVHSKSITADREGRLPEVTLCVPATISKPTFNLPNYSIPI
jgi:hypothetical protein